MLAFNSDVTGWDVSGKFKTLTRCSTECANFDQDLGYWDVSDGRSMAAMFRGATFFNQDLSYWCVSLISDEPADFRKDSGFEAIDAYQPDWGVCPEARKVIFFTWDGDGTLNLSGEYEAGATGKIQSPDGEETGITGAWNRSYTNKSGSYIIDSEGLTRISFKNSTGNWFFKPLSYTSDLEDLHETFYNCTSFNSDISWWDTAKVTNMSSMFYNTNSFRSNLGDWDVEQVENMYGMFQNNFVFRSDLRKWNTSNVQNMSRILQECRSWNAPIMAWDTSKVTNMSFMFYNANRFNQPLGEWDVSLVTNMRGMFQKVTPYDQDLTPWCVTNVTDYVYFASQAKFETNTDKHPQWGTCPPKLIVAPVIAAEDESSLICDIGADIIIKADAITDPVGTVTNQWQMRRVGDSLGDWENLSGETGDRYTAQEGDYRIRLLQTITADTGVRKAASNEVRVDISIFGDFVAFKIAPEINNRPFTLRGTLIEETSYVYNPNRERIVINPGEWSAVFDKPGVYLVGSEYLTSVNLQDMPCDFTIDPTSYMEKIDDMSYLVNNCSQFTQDMSWLDTSKVKSIAYIFNGCSKQSSDLSYWDTSNCTNFAHAIQGTNVAYGPDAWDLSLAEDISFIAYSANFIGDCSSWDLSRVLKADAPLLWHSSQNTNISKWTLPKATSINKLFINATDTSPKGTGSKLNFSSVKDANEAFSGNKKADWDSSSWNFSNLTNAFRMFYSFGSSYPNKENYTNIIGSPDWKFDNVVNASSMFESSYGPWMNYSENWVFSNLSNGVQMFRSLIDTVDISGMEPQRVKNLTNMFNQARDFRSRVGKWKIASGANMGRMLNATCSWVGDMSTWCFAGSVSTSSWNQNSNIQQQPHLYPQFGKCPPYSLIDIVIQSDTTNSGDGSPGDTLSIVSYAHTSQSPVDTSELQWQSKKTGSLSFENLDGETGTTYVMAADDDAVRVVEKFIKDGAYGYSYSNTVKAQDPPAFTYIAVEMYDPEEGESLLGGKTFKINGFRTKPDGLMQTPDGTQLVLGKGSFQRVFKDPGVYYVRVDEGLDNINFKDSNGVRFKVLETSDFSTITNMDNMFRNCSHAQGDVNWMPWASATSMNYAFSQTSASGISVDLDDADISNCTGLAGLFFSINADQVKVKRITAHPTEQTNCSDMFAYVGVGNDPTWFNDRAPTAIVGSAVRMFKSITGSAIANTEIVIPSRLDFGQVTNMVGCFQATKVQEAIFNLSNCNTSNVTRMDSCFAGASISGVVGLENWNVSNVINMTQMFNDYFVFGGQESQWKNMINQNPNWYPDQTSYSNVGKWDVGNVANFYNMFRTCTNMPPILSEWKPVKMTSGNAYNMFNYARNYLEDLTSWCVPNCTSMPRGFFNGGAVMSGRTDLHPLWGQCPAKITQPAQIEGENGDWGTSGSAVSWVSDAIIDPAGTEIRSIWQYSYFNGTKITYSNYGSETTDQIADFNIPSDGIINGKTVIGVRLKQIIANAFGNVTSYSNFVFVDKQPQTNKQFKFTVTNVDSGIVLVKGHKLGYTQITGPSGQIPIDYEFTLGLSEPGDYTLISNDLVTISFGSDQKGRYTLDPTSDTSDFIYWNDSFVNDFCQTTDLTWVDTSNIKCANNCISKLWNGENYDITGWDFSSCEKFDSGAPSGGSNYRTLPTGFCNLDFSNCTSLNGLFRRAKLKDAEVVTLNANADFSKANSINAMFYESVWTSGATYDFSNIRFKAAGTNCGNTWGIMRAVDSTTGSNVSYNKAAPDLSALAVVKFGKLVSTNCDNSFQRINNVLVELPNFELKTTNANNMCNQALGVPQMDTWDVSQVTTFHRAFNQAASPYPQSLSSWNTSNVNNMANMFYGCYMDELDVSKWDVSKVQNFLNCFNNLKSSVDVNPGNWDTSSARQMNTMFSSFQPFNSDCSRWCVSFTSKQPSGWNTNTNQSSYDDKQPQWGKCPPATNGELSIVDTRGSAGELGHTLVVLNKPVLKNPDANPPITYQWQRKGEIDLNFSDIPGANGEQYEIVLDDLRGHVRLSMLFGDSSTGVNRQISNEIYVLDFVTPEGMAVTFGVQRSGEAPLISIKGSASNPSTITFEDGTVKNITGDFSVTYSAQGTYFIQTNFLTRLSFENTNTTIFINPNSEMGQFSDASRMFYNTTMFDQDLSWWDTKYITNMAEMFFYSMSFDGNISSWDVANVTNMSSMFSNAFIFNQDLSQWNVSKVETVMSMFASAFRFNQSLPEWNFSSLTDMSLMFAGAKTFDGEVTNWNVGNVTNMYGVFSEATMFNQNVDSWDTSKVTNMQLMFSDTQFFNQPLANWEVANVSNMAAMFENAVVFEQDLSGWCVALPPGHEEFARSAKFETKPELQPQWGTCPPPTAFSVDMPIVLTNPVISQPSGDGYLPGDVIYVVSNGTVDKVATRTYQWQSKGPNADDFSNIYAKNANSLTVMPVDAGHLIRLKQTFTNEGEVAVAYSNEVQVL